MGFLSDLGDVLTGKHGIDQTKKFGDKTGINDALDKAGFAELGTVASIFDPADLAGTVSKGKAEDALAAEEHAQLESPD